MIQGSGSGFSELFGVEAEAVGLQVRHGLTERVDLTGNADLVHITQRGAADVHPNIYNGRIGVRWAPELLANYVALTGGIGGGGHAAGGYVSPDAGLVVAFENAYVVPFASGSALVSVPLGPQPVDLSDGEEDPGTDVQTPVTTWGAILSLGLLIPVRFGPEESQSRGGIGLAVSFTWLDDGKEDAMITGITPALELSF